MAASANGFLLSSLVGSSISTIASLLLILCYVCLPSCRTYRHRLILSLSIADFLNSLNNTVSGIQLGKEGVIHPGTFCSINGFVGQVTVQAQDFSTLLIAVVTYSAISKPLEWLHALNFLQVYEPWLYICVWGFSLTTALIGQFTVGYVPVSGNWCWLPPHPAWVRYALTHGFRFAIIPLVFFFYIRLYLILKKTSLSQNSSDQTYANDSSTHGGIELASNYQEFYAEPSLRSEVTDTNMSEVSRHIEANSNHEPKFTTLMIKFGLKKSPKSPGKTGADGLPMKRPSSNEKRITRVMLKMCLYPVVYTICWIPGILNRMIEISGDSNRILTVMQASSQFIGLCDAIMYGLTENLKEEIRLRITGRSKLTASPN
ncbi:hypothetical protein K7432_001796 [Basidiobolus ranarum]|uniref:G-protein coupled receptors family 1 profile domain-containing protein n=1 Tax=Basidiobolus ranarum TaxID=34480 RepID=A0ABR2W904_9FUNG